ncbi:MULTISPECIES: hypothetical protein [unclassified Rhodococcus (in: high G+C Gram-positive bacteria)]|uniref:hypothetical protein n=1 Tax=unclassified Rhodococcus (in: high G+C Gram-positive bacteria) TaxID=192944 RepID=UPI00163B4192|nr:MULTISPECIES: hypothetical protein [unclassified Rhodococcus (in: high G+C Gram-positive bacteria)]MBC2638663.1 hypothetical protein [Rhodococcus sp. 3A]MBC2896596.1 hypothetical protein [Rhodococcus sp. 4CII]
MNALGVADLADRTTDELVDSMRLHAEPSGLPAGFGGMIGLVDGMIHQQDIRRPLAIPRTIPQDRLRAALEFARFASLIRPGAATHSATSPAPASRHSPPVSAPDRKPGTRRVRCSPCRSGAD